MSELKLGNISIIEPTILQNQFIIGDTVKNGGYSSPVLISDEISLARYFRYAEHYEEYLAIIRAGGVLALAGNQDSYDDIPTIVIFNQNPEINADFVPAAHPRYEFLFKNLEELLEELKKMGSPYKTIGNIDRFVGYSKDKSQTYKISWIADEDVLSRILLKSATEDPYSLVLPGEFDGVKSFFSLVLMDDSVDPNTGEYIYNDPPWVDDWIDYYGTNLVKEAEVLRVPCRQGSTIQGLLFRIRNSRLANKYGFYRHSGVNGNTLTLIGPNLSYSFDFCTRYCDVIKQINDQDFTQLVYYIRGLKNQGIGLAAYSNFANKEGRNIDLRYECSGVFASIKIDLQNESYEYSSDNLLKDAVDNPLLTFTDINYQTEDYEGNTFTTIIPYQLQSTDSYKNPTNSYDSLVDAYESFLEYEIPISVLIGPLNIKDYWKVSYTDTDGEIQEDSRLFSVLKRISNDHLQGGLSSTICLTEHQGEKYVTDIITKLLNPDRVFWFSGEFKFDSVYRYIIKFLSDRKINSDPGVDIVEGDAGMTFHYNGYEVLYDLDYKWLVSLAVSHALNAIYQSVTPGIYEARAKRLVQNTLKYVEDFHPIVQSIVINSLKQDGNTFIVDIDINYTGVPNIIIMNFKLYKSYGT